jgi:carboxyl-terminal processing protease
MKLKRTILGPILVALVAFVSGGWLLQRGVTGERRPSRAAVLEEVLQRVSRDYVDEHPSTELYRMAVEGLLRELGDPHTSFMTAEEYRTSASRPPASTAVSASRSPSATAGSR